MLYNSVPDLPVTLADIKIRAEKDVFINEKEKKQVKWKLNEQNKKEGVNSRNLFSICDGGTFIFRANCYASFLAETGIK